MTDRQSTHSLSMMSSSTSVLIINALLSSGPDYDVLFDSLCWDSDQYPVHAYHIDALTAFIEGLHGLLLTDDDETPAVEEEDTTPCSSSSSSPPAAGENSKKKKKNAPRCCLTAAKKRALIATIESVVWSQCIALLARISADDTASASRGGITTAQESTGAACRLLGTCAPLCDASVPERLWHCVLPALQPPKSDDEHGHHQASEEEAAPVRRIANVDIAVEVMAVLLPTLTSSPDEKHERLTHAVLSSAVSFVKHTPDTVAVSKVAVRILLTLLNCYGGGGGPKLGSTLRFIVEDLCGWHASDCTGAVTERTLLCFTVLSDHLFPPTSQQAASGHPDPRLSVQFWRMIQDGLTHADNVSRKRALYLLKRAVARSEEEEEEACHCPRSSSDQDEILFRWDPSRSKLLKEFWEDYALVMETLEENQIHVIRPVLNRIDMLIQTTASDSEVSGCGLFHPSWLLCVYQRMFHSENKSLMKEGVWHLLGLQALRQPAFASAFSKFIVGPFMDVLSESSLFHRAAGQSVGDCPELGVKLQAFMVTFFTSLPLEDRGPVLLQLIQRLGSQHWCAVPILFLSEALSCLPDSPLLGTEGLNALREVLRCTMITHQVLLRGAAQCFLLRSALRLTDVTTVGVDDVFSFLMHFRPDESLCRGTSLWIQLCAWLSINEGTFSVRAYVQSEMHTFLQVPASTGQNESLPDPKEADKLARAVLLCVDMQESTDTGLEALLSPLLDTLSRISTNVYLPLRKTDKCLQLLLRLLQLKATPRCRKAEDKQGDRVAVDMEKIMLRVLDPVQEFILRRLCGELVEVCDVERAELYLCVLRQLVAMYGGVPQYRSKMQQTYFPKLIRGCLRILQEPTPQILSIPGQVCRAVAMASLATVCVLAEQQHMSDQRSETTAALSSLSDYLYSSAQCASNSQSPLGRFNQRLLKPQTVDCTSDAGLQGPVLQNWGRMSAHFMRDQWICLSFLMRAGVMSDTEETSRTPGGLEAALACCVEALSLLPNDLVLPVLAFMEQVLPKVVHAEEDLCAEAVSMSWELVQGLSTNPSDFWPALRSFVSMAYHRQLLALTGAPKFTALLKQVASDMVELSQCKTGVFNVLIQHCCHTWLPGPCTAGPGGSRRWDSPCTAGPGGSLRWDSPCTGGPGGSRRWDVNATFSSTFVHIDILAEACVYGPVFRRDQRLIQEVQTYVEQLGEQCSANAVVTGEDRDEQMARTCALAFLSRLEGSDPLHEKLMEELVTLLLKKEKEISRSKVRYYSNSLQHRVKNRVWQTLLLLLPKLKEEFVVTVLNQVFEAGFCSNQASVKYLMEWMMILILFHYPQHIERLWACFNVDQEKTKTSICTFLSVLVHLNIILPLTKDKAVQWRRALDVCLQWCFCHNFSVRLYALLALKRVWSLGPGVREEAQAQQGPICDGLGGLASVVETCLNQAEAMQNSGNANKNWIRIQEHFFFGAFHPIRDYSIETIFHTFPSLSEVSDDEWIPPWKFEKLSGFSESPTLPLRNPVPDLSRLPPGDWVQQDKAAGEQDREERWAEVQKKITPWRLGIHEQEPELQPLVPQQRASRLGNKLYGALVVVASLIDKPTNLGGLCRTCEIFGASALVLDSLRHIADKHFQALSVSSELWLPLQEVKPAELPDFLLLKKSEGYCIVGVEQTANSHSLQDYQFPEKTLLLLGNEREGIPANLLQLLDVCVEIPQQGIIRSLNVHVSAALLIWEYTRQHFTSG